jgi:tetratricopeptide (TPR) repeat protein
MQSKGDVLMTMGKYEDALAEYDRAIQIDPMFPRIWYKKGLALKALDRNSDADAAIASTAGLK